MQIPYYLPFRWYFSIYKFFVRLATTGTPFSSRMGTFARLLRVHVKRPEWLYYPGVDLEPVKHFTFSPRVKPDARAVSLCNRLLAAYRLAGKASPPLETPGGLWRNHVQQRCRKLVTTLERGAPDELAELLAGMFQEPFIDGITSGARGLMPGYASFWRMSAAMDVLSLAEALGLVRAETPEQGILGHALAQGWPELVRKIERHLGISIDFPKVAGAYGLQFGQTLVTKESSGHIYAANRINETIERHGFQKLRIVEIGAGFGGTAYWLMQLRKRNVAAYTIIDLPLVNVCQGYFLATVFGADAVRLYGEPEQPGQLIHVLPAHALKEKGFGNFDVLINENSMPEMPEQVVKDYLAWARNGLTGFFYSYNQEAYSPVDGVPQTLVPKAIADVGGYQRLSRNYSWVRKGYVEEIYSVHA